MPIKSPKEKTRRIMGLAASQARLLTLTSDKLHLEKQISINTNRKMALTAEMSRLAFEKNSKLNSYQYQVSTLDGGMHEINYEYLMGKSGGVQDISTKSEDKMMLFDAASGKVVLTEEMANKIGSVKKLRENQNEKYAAIARLCGDVNLTVPENLPSNINISFCADTELIQDICNGKYNSYGLNDLTMAINKYQLYAYATNGDANGNILPAFQVYQNRDSEQFPYLFYVETIYGDPNLIGDSYEAEIEGVSGNNKFSWAHAYQASGDRGVHYWNGSSSDPVDTSLKNVIVNVGTLSENNENGKRELLTKVVTSFAESYSNQTKISMLKLDKAINQTVNEFLSNSFAGIFTIDGTDSTHTITESYFDEGDNNNLERKDFLSTIKYRIIERTDSVDSKKDSKRLCVFVQSNDSNSNKKDMYVDVSALASYFHAAVLGEGVGYRSKDGMDEFLYGAYEANSSSDGSKTPVLFHDKFAVGGTQWKEYGLQNFVPAGQSTEQWLSSFDKLINDVKFYAPIVDACIKFGYTTKYDDYIKTDKSYVDESLQNGTFQIMDFDAENGVLDGSHNTKYYLMFSEIFKADDESQKLEVQAWYQKEKNSIKHKEDVLDTIINQMNTELNSINTEIESIKSFIDDSKKKFEWCTG